MKPTLIYYDIEIAKCIPDDRGKVCDAYEYCDGWGDFKNMGISVIGYAVGDDPPEAIEWYEGFFFSDGLTDDDNDDGFCVVGFNSRRFDDRLAEANDLNIQADYDLLEEIRKAAYGSPRWQDQPRGFSYSLDAIAKANGMAKTGSGALAPQLWQQGRKQEVIDYCLNNVVITRELLKLGLDGKLKDPNTGKLLELAPLPR